MRNVTTAALLSAAAGLLVATVPAPASAQEMSEKSVRSMMDYAWGLTPEKFTKPDGSLITVDRSARDKTLPPLDVAREIIRVGRISAYAQRCGLVDEQRQNYLSLMKREEAKGKWTEPQLLYMSQLHLFTVMLLTGKVKVVERDGDKEVVASEDALKNTETCTAEQALATKEAIATYVKAGPSLQAGAPAAVPAPGAATPAAAKGAAPAEKKK
jgi:hypothetical protein